MGLHICLNNRYGHDHPEWDYLRRGNDRLFPSLINWDNIISHPNWEDYFRPTDLQELKLRIVAMGWDDPERYLHLIKLLEDDQDNWLMFSY